MSIESQETLLEKNAVLDAINALRQETSALRQETGALRQEMKSRFDKIENDIEEIKNSQFSFDVRLERVQAMAHESLNIGHNLQADVKILRAGIGAWAKDVMRLEKQLA